MVGNGPDGPVNGARCRPQKPKIEPQRLAGAPARRSRASIACARLPPGSAAYLVGGAVRDLLLGRGRADIDVAVEGDVARARAAPRRRDAHPRALRAPRPFASTASRSIWRRRAAETYARPGALPEVQPGDARARTSPAATSRQRDGGAARRRSGADRSPRGLEDLRARRAAGAAHRLVRGRPNPRPAGRAIRGALRVHAGARDRGAASARGLSTVSRDRMETELRKLAAEPEARRGVRVAARMGVARPDARARRTWSGRWES